MNNASFAAVQHLHLLFFIYEMFDNIDPHKY